MYNHQSFHKTIVLSNIHLSHFQVLSARERQWVQIIAAIQSIHLQNSTRVYLAYQMAAVLSMKTVFHVAFNQRM